MNILPGILTAAVLVATPGLAFADTPAPIPNNGPGQFADAPLKTASRIPAIYEELGIPEDYGFTNVDASPTPQRTKDADHA